MRLRLFLKVKPEIGRTACRGRGFRAVEISVVDVTLKKKK
jgi:hypothetical protein